MPATRCWRKQDVLGEPFPGKHFFWALSKWFRDLLTWRFHLSCRVFLITDGLLFNELIIHESICSMEPQEFNIFSKCCVDKKGLNLVLLLLSWWLSDCVLLDSSPVDWMGISRGLPASLTGLLECFRTGMLDNFSFSFTSSLARYLGPGK